MPRRPVNNQPAVHCRIGEQLKTQPGPHQRPRRSLPHGQLRKTATSEGPLDLTVHCRMAAQKEAQPRFCNCSLPRQALRNPSRPAATTAPVHCRMTLRKTTGPTASACWSSLPDKAAPEKRRLEPLGDVHCRIGSSEKNRRTTRQHRRSTAATAAQKNGRQSPSIVPAAMAAQITIAQAPCSSSGRFTDRIGAQKISTGALLDLRSLPHHSSENRPCARLPGGSVLTRRRLRSCRAGRPRVHCRIDAAQKWRLRQWWTA